jgi:hypothetical protein
MEIPTEKRAFKNASVIPAEIVPTKRVELWDGGTVVVGEFVYTG